MKVYDFLKRLIVECLYINVYMFELIRYVVLLFYKIVYLNLIKLSFIYYIVVIYKLLIDYYFVEFWFYRLIFLLKLYGSIRNKFFILFVCLMLYFLFYFLCIFLCIMLKVKIFKKKKIVIVIDKFLYRIWLLK